MHQRELLDETIDFLRPSEREQRGVEFHEQYFDSIYLIALALVVGLIVHWMLFGLFYALVFGFLVLAGGIFSELILRKLYGFTGQDAVKHYSLKFYDDPDDKTLRRLHSWNRNPFDLSTEYYYPRLGQLIEESKQQENTVEYAHKRIPDELRLIEKRESEEYQTLVDVNIEDLSISPYYKSLLREANYCYKFGAYTSVSVLLRKIAERLLVDILISKGLYTELTSEYGFEEIVSVFIEHVISGNYPEDMESDLEESLNVWIRKKGNKGAHKGEEFTKDEIEQLMEHARRSIRLLIVMHAEIDTDQIDEAELRED